MLHIGPHKTGTSAIQGALEHGREAMADHGVAFPGSRSLQMHAARAVIGINGLPGDLQPKAEHWEQLCAETAAAHDQRVVISRETFCSGRHEETIRRIVDGLGGPRVHVLVTLRRLANILPSAWQQTVRDRSAEPYEAWLDRVFNTPANRPTPRFWRGQRHDALVRRWASVVGPDRVTVVVVDDYPGDQLLRPVEQLLGLPPELLKLNPERANRSLSYPEIELIRRVCARFIERGWSGEFHRDVVRHGMLRQLQRAKIPGSDESRIVTPKWALDRAVEIQAEVSEAIAASGVRIVGDITNLGTARSQPAVDSALDESDSPQIPVSAATEVVFGAVVAGIQREKALNHTIRRKETQVNSLRRKAERASASQRVSDVRSTELLFIVASRIGRRLRRTLRPPG